MAEYRDAHVVRVTVLAVIGLTVALLLPSVSSVGKQSQVRSPGVAAQGAEQGVGGAR